jgi:hypothetical protein
LSCWAGSGYAPVDSSPRKDGSGELESERGDRATSEPPRALGATVPAAPGCPATAAFWESVDSSCCAMRRRTPTRWRRMAARSTIESSCATVAKTWRALTPPAATATYALGKGYFLKDGTHVPRHRQVQGKREVENAPLGRHRHRRADCSSRGPVYRAENPVGLLRDRASASAPAPQVVRGASSLGVRPAPITS